MEKVQYSSLNNHLRKKFGCKVYKVALDGGFSCPNRDGSLDTRGCIFCSAGGSGDFASDRRLSIKDQLAEGKAFIKDKLPKGEPVKYIAYFQAFTNTYGPIDKLKEEYMSAINDEEVCILSIATRPDCLSEDVLSLLKECNRIKPVWVELGLQTVKEASAIYIRRGYTLDVYDEAVKNLHDIGIEVITHVILGLPGESREDMLDTVKHVVKVKSDGIKLQLLHVLKGTDLSREYEEGNFKTFEMDEYIETVVECLKIIPKTMVVHRLTGDGDKKLLVAPLWSADKKKVLNEVNKLTLPV